VRWGVLDSIAGRLMLIAALGLAVALGGGGVALAHAFRSALEQAFDARLEAAVLSLAASVQALPDGTLELARPLGDPRFDRVLSGWYWVVESDDEVVLASRSLWDGQLAGTAARKEGPAFDLVGPGERRLRAKTRRVTVPGHPAPLSIRVAGDPAEVDAEVERITTIALLALAATASLWLLWLFAQLRFGLRPLLHLSRDVQRLRAGAIDRLPAESPRELRLLVDSLNDLIAHDAELVARARARAGDLAHGLRTRLALIRAELEKLPPESAAFLRTEVESMRRIVERHLARAAIAGPTPGRQGEIGISATCGPIAAGLRKLHPQHAIEIDVDAGLRFRMDPEDLEEIVGNLAENACKWARRQVSIRAARAGAGLRVEIEDDGPGFPSSELSRVGERGARLDEEIPGSGLGLAIVQDVLDAYGGQLALEPSPLGGLLARVWLPDDPGTARVGFKAERSDRRGRASTPPESARA